MSDSATVTTVRVILGDDKFAEERFVGLPPLGSTGAEYLIAAWIFPRLQSSGRSGPETCWVEYEYSGDGDPPIRMARETTVGDLACCVLDTAARPKSSAWEGRTLRGGPYKGWIRATDGWVLDPECDNAPG